MTEEDTSPRTEKAREVEQDVKKIRPIRRLFLLDVITDPDSRPLFAWAGLLLLIGTVAYHWLEGWSFLDSLYFCVITLATIGYGDYVPTSSVAKLFTVFYAINGVGILVALFDRIRVVRANRAEAAMSQAKPRTPAD